MVSSIQLVKPPSPLPRTSATVAPAVPIRQPDELVTRAQKGDATAFAELFRRHRDAVVRIAFRMLGPGADLEDVAQEVFLQVFRSLPDFRGQAKFTTWLHRVTVNVVLMVRRRARSRPVLTGEQEGKQESAEQQLPDQALLREQRLEAFRRLLDRLSEKKRTVFVLHELEGMTPTRIAEIVDCPVLTVRTRLFYARRELAELMRAEPSLAQLIADEPPSEPPGRSPRSASTEKRAPAPEDSGASSSQEEP